MKQLMESILSIDQQQDQRLQDMLQQKKQAFSKIDQQAAQLADEIQEYARLRLLQVEQINQQQAEQQLHKADQLLETKKRRLKQQYDENKDFWVKNIVDAILRADP